MKKLLFILFFSLSTNTFSQIHNRMIKLNVGISKEQFGLKNKTISYNDTSANQFTFNSASPVFSISEEFTFNERFSLSGTFGYQYFDIDYNSNKYGYDLFFITINPQLSVFYHKGFEYYIKLKAGIIYRNGNLDIVSEQTQRHFASKTNLVTGVTLIGLHFFVSNNWAINTEFSIWSPEWVNLGISYRFFKGEMPKVEGYFTD
jgi:hypothetical protein